MGQRIKISLQLLSPLGGKRKSSKIPEVSLGRPKILEVSICSFLQQEDRRPFKSVSGWAGIYKEGRKEWEEEDGRKGRDEKGVCGGIRGE